MPDMEEKSTDSQAHTHPIALKEELTLDLSIAVLGLLPHFDVNCVFTKPKSDLGGYK